MTDLNLLRLLLIFIILVVFGTPGCTLNRTQNAATANNSNRRVETIGFREITGAKDGQFVTVTEYLDFKYLCPDVSPTQREICSAAVVSFTKNRDMEVAEIKLHVCSETRKTSCIVYELNSTENRVRPDMRDVFVYDQSGMPIDFDGETLMIDLPNTWTANPKKLKLTGKVTVIDGQGRFIEPIDKIEAAE